MTRTITMRLVSPSRPDVRTPFASSSPRVTVGRDPAADWALPDSARLLSRLHFEISNDADGVFAHDHSANGLVVNSAVDPVGKGRKIALNTGDLLRFGPYVAEILITQTATAPQDDRISSLTAQADMGEDRAARLAALAAFEPDISENAVSAPKTESPGMAASAEVEEFEIAAPAAHVVAVAASNAAPEANFSETLNGFARSSRVLIPADWNDMSSPSASLSHEQAPRVSSGRAGDVRSAVLDALAKLACAVDPDSLGRPYANALHEYAVSGRISLDEIQDDFDNLNRKVLRLLSEQTPGSSIRGSDAARPTHEH